MKRLMKRELLYKALPFLNNIGRKRREEIERYFESAPNWLLESVHEKHLDKDITFIEENKPVDWVYIVGEGSFKATEFRIFGIVYDFMVFKGISAMGGMEIIMEEKFYRTTLTTVTPCTMIVIPKIQFEHWIYTDIKALRQEAKNMAYYLLEQGRQGRAFLFLRGVDRLCLLFVQQYKQQAKGGTFLWAVTRRELSEKIGVSVKTINRAIEKLENENLLKRRGYKIQIDEEQFFKMQKMISEILEE